MAGNGLWATAANWNLDRLPQAGDDVTITNAGNTAAVTSTGSVTVDSVTSSIPINLTGGDIITTGGGAVATGGVTLTNGAALTITNGAVLSFDGGSQTLGSPDDTGSLVFGNTSANKISLDADVQLTVTAGFTISGQTGSIGQAVITNPTGTIINNGTIEASTAGDTLTLNASAVTNTSGTIEALNGGILALDDGVTGGTITTDNVVGSKVTQNSATITNATISGDLVPTDISTNFLSGVTVSSSGVVNLSGAEERIINNLTLNGTINVKAFSYLGFGSATGQSDTVSGSGSGQIVFDSNTSNDLSLDYGVAVTIGPGVTIDGQNGTIGTAVYTNPTGTLIVASGNTGATITANVSGGTLKITANTTNNGTIEALNGGILALDAGLTGGTIATDGAVGSEVIQNGVTIANATISGDLVPTDTSSNFLSGVTVGSGATVNIIAAEERLTNNLTLNGTINVNANSYLGFGSTTGQSDTVSGSGNGQIVFDANLSNSISLDYGVAVTIGPGVTIEGQNGTIGTARFADPTGTLIVASGNPGATIIANVSGGTLAITANTTNNGTIEALDGGILALYAGVTGGTIATDSAVGSEITQNGITIANATISGDLVPNDNESNFLSGITVSSNAVVNLNDVYERIINNLTLNGTINVKGGTYFGFGSATGQSDTVSGSGNGQIVFDSNTNNSLSLDYGVAVTLGAGVTIDGQNGSIGTARISGPTGTLIVASGNPSASIIANVDGSILVIDANTTNNGTVEAQNGGTLEIASCTVSGTGTITTDAGSQVTQVGATVAGNTISGDLVPNDNESNFLSGITVASSGVVNMSDVYERIINSLTLNGTINVKNASILGFGSATGQSVTVSGSGNGQIVFDSNTSNDLSLDYGVAVTIGAGVTIDGQNGSLGLAEIVGPTGTLTVATGGAIAANSVSAGTFTINPASWTNNGTVSVTAGNKLISTATLTNFSGSTLTGGTYLVGGTFEFPGASIVTNAASITLDGTASAFLNQSNSANALTGFNTNTAAGSFTLKDGRTLTTPNITGTFTNAGSMTVQDTAELTASGIYLQSAGSTTLVTGGSLQSTQGINIQAGVLQGTGTVVGNLQNGAMLAPGTNSGTLAAGTITVTGNYTQSFNGSPGTFHEKLGGTSADSMISSLSTTWPL